MFIQYHYIKPLVLFDFNRCFKIHRYTIAMQSLSQLLMVIPPLATFHSYIHVVWFVIILTRDF